MNTNDYLNINFNASKEELNEIVELLKTDYDSILSAYGDWYGFGDFYIWNRLKDNFPGLKDATKAQMDSILELLKCIHKHHLRQCPDAFFMDDGGRRKINYEIVLDCLMRNYTFKTLDDTEDVLVYEEGVYRRGTTVIKEFVESVLGDFADKRIVGEIIAHVQRRTYTQRDLFNTNMQYMPVLNGLLNLDTLELESFDPHKLFTYRLNVEYDPSTGYSHTEDFFREVLNQADIPVMQEAFGYCLHSGYPAHKLFWWLGSGRNGKTTTGNLLTALIGFENTAGVPLKQLDGGHRFAVARLFGKLLNVVAEPETKSVLQTPTLKSAVGGDLIYGEKKNVQDAFPFVNFAKIVVYANEVPRIEDESYAFWTRVVAIEFPHTFEGADAKKDYHEVIINGDGLAGVLNWALVGLQRLKKRNWEFTLSDAQTITKIGMKRQSQPVASFIEDWTEFDNTAKIAKETLYDAYKIYCNVYGLLVPLEGEFTRDLKRSANVKLKKPRVGKTRVPYWQGLKIKDSIEVGIAYIHDKQVRADEITVEDEADITFKTYPLAEYVSGSTGSTGTTFFYASLLGEKTVIIENKDILPLYKASENTLDQCDQCDQCKKSYKSATLRSFDDLCVCPTCFAALTAEVEQAALEEGEEEQTLEEDNETKTEFKKAADEARAAKKRVKSPIVSEQITKEEEWQLTYLKKTYDITPKRKPGVFVCDECGDTETTIYYIPATKHPASCLKCLEESLVEQARGDKHE